MAITSRYTVPLESLTGVRVDVEDQIAEHAVAEQPIDAARWGGSLEAAYGEAPGGGSGACDGGGE